MLVENKNQKRVSLSSLCEAHLLSLAMPPLWATMDFIPIILLWVLCLVVLPEMRGYFDLFGYIFSKSTVAHSGGRGKGQWEGPTKG